MNSAVPERKISILTVVSVAVVFAAGVIIGGLVHSGSSTEALAQPVRTAATGGIIAFPTQLTRDSYGITMIDVDLGTLWMYQVKGEKLKLLAARNWVYDRRLQEYNSVGLTPGQVEELVTAGEEGLSPASGTEVPEKNPGK